MLAGEAAAAGGRPPPSSLLDEEEEEEDVLPEAAAVGLGAAGRGALNASTPLRRLRISPLVKSLKPL